MTQANSNEPTLNSIANQVEQVTHRVEQVNQRVEQVTHQVEQVTHQVEQVNVRLGKIEQELRETNNRVEIYQKASTQVVNLAFSLIASATVTVIITSVLRK